MRISVAITVLFALLAGVFGTAPAEAQRVQRIAAIVNDDIVSVYDLQARMRIVISSTGLKPTAKFRQRLARQILRRLVDERLQLQEAKRRNVSVSRRNMARAIADIEKQNQVPPGGFDQFVARSGIAKDAALAQIRAQIAWGKLVGRVLSPRITVGEDEIEERLNRLKSRRGETEYRLSEILLTVDNPQATAEIRRTAERLVDGLRQDTDFKALARQFSRGASASVGGDLGWIGESALESDLRAIVMRMEPGQIVGPVETLAGIHILKLQRKRRVMDAPDDKTIIDLRQILFAVLPGATRRDVAAQTDLAGLIADTVSGCADMARAAREARSSGPTELGKFRLSDLAAKVRAAVESLPVGKPSKPVRTNTGVALFMVCEKTAPKSNLPSREQIAERIRRERLEILARRYMRDLRSAAIIDLRV